MFQKFFQLTALDISYFSTGTKKILKLIRNFKIFIAQRYLMAD